MTLEEAQARLMQKRMRLEQGLEPARDPEDYPPLPPNIPFGSESSGDRLRKKNREIRKSQTDFLREKRAEVILGREIGSGILDDDKDETRLSKKLVRSFLGEFEADSSKESAKIRYWSRPEVQERIEQAKLNEVKLHRDQARARIERILEEDGLN